MAAMIRRRRFLAGAIGSPSVDERRALAPVVGRPVHHTPASPRHARRNPAGTPLDLRVWRRVGRALERRLEWRAIARPTREPDQVNVLSAPHDPIEQVAELPASLGI